MTKPIFTYEEVLEHNKKDDLYVIIRQKVYNLTEFAKRHPGGADPLLYCAGKDATQVFETYHPLETNKMLEKFYVGQAQNHELPTFPEPNAFFRTLKSRIEQYFKDTKQDMKYNNWMALRYLSIYSTVFLSYMAMIMEYQSVLASIVLGFALAMICLMPVHDASHFSVTHSKIVWKVLSATHDFLNGTSNLTWFHQHILGHHPYTNVINADPDIDTNEVDIRRIKDSQKWFSFYKLQQYYAPALYGLLGLKTRMQDFRMVFHDKSVNAIRINPPSFEKLLIFFGGKAFFVFYRLLIPMYILGAYKAIAYFLLSDMVTSYWLAFCFQASHVVSEVKWVTPSKDNTVDMDWFEMQIATSMDYSHDSWFFTFFTGALNYQVVHHLFPGISQVYYPEIAPIIKKTCKEFGIQYHYKCDFISAIGAHLNHLLVMGRPKFE